MIIPFHFSESDFARCVPPCKASDLSQELLDRLEYARSLCGFSFILTSAYRTQEYEHDKNRTGSSSHCKGLAVDISCNSEERRYILVQNLLRAGFSRIGIGKTFIHADIDRQKKSCIWLYD